MCLFGTEWGLAVGYCECGNELHGSKTQSKFLGQMSDCLLEGRILMQAQLCSYSVQCGPFSCAVTVYSAVRLVIFKASHFVCFFLPCHLSIKVPVSSDLQREITSVGCKTLVDMSQFTISICRSSRYLYVAVHDIDMSQFTISICRSSRYRHVAVHDIDMSQFTISIYAYDKSLTHCTKNFVDTPRNLKI